MDSWSFVFAMVTEYLLKLLNSLYIKNMLARYFLMHMSWNFIHNIKMNNRNNLISQTK